MHASPEPMQKEPTRFRESKKHGNVKKAEAPFESSKRLPRRRAGKIRRAGIDLRTGRPDGTYGLQTGRSTPGYN